MLFWSMCNFGLRALLSIACDMSMTIDKNLAEKLRCKKIAVEGCDFEEVTLYRNFLSLIFDCIVQIN